MSGPPWAREFRASARAPRRDKRTPKPTRPVHKVRLGKSATRRNLPPDMAIRKRNLTGIRKNELKVPKDPRSTLLPRIANLKDWPQRSRPCRRHCAHAILD